MFKGCSYRKTNLEVSFSVNLTSLFYIKSYIKILIEMFETK